jgi:SAM-dependent methyltransferase
MKMIDQLRAFVNNKRKRDRIKKYERGNRVPWSIGYSEFRELRISEAIIDNTLLEKFSVKQIPDGYGIAIDERVVEYPWLFSQLSGKESLFLDAGSTFNFEYLLSQEKLQSKKIHICTYYPESPNFNEKGVSYIYSDLRRLPYKDNLFDEIVCQSTIEHIDMDNSIYGYSPDGDKTNQNKSYAYLDAIKELIRILKPQGLFLLTFPFGKYENHVFFQQFDGEMLSLIEDELDTKGMLEISFIKYLQSGWKFASQEECSEMESFNPHTGKGMGNDGAAHCRCVCLIKFKKD